MQVALYFYRNLRNYLEKQGFEVNNYDSCVSNRMVNGHHLTVLWHVDDMLIAHVDPRVLETMIQFLQVSYESSKLASSCGKIKVTCGNVNVYLGMTLTF